MKTIEQRAIWLIGASVEDLKSSLHHKKADELPVLERALTLARERNWKTKAKYLAAKIRQLKKTQEAAQC